MCVGCPGPCECPCDMVSEARVREEEAVETGRDKVTETRSASCERLGGDVLYACRADRHVAARSWRLRRERPPQHSPQPMARLGALQHH